MLKEFAKEVFKLKFAEEPNYNKLQHLLKMELVTRNYSPSDLRMDWSRWRPENAQDNIDHDASSSCPRLSVGDELCSMEGSLQNVGLNKSVAHHEESKEIKKPQKERVPINHIYVLRAKSNYSKLMGI